MTEVPSNSECERAVVLAAGRGGRLGARTDSLPKPLVEVAGMPMILRTLRGLHAAGIAEAVVVTGYRGDQVAAEISPRAPLRVRAVANGDHDRGASFSLRAAREAVAGSPFLLTMADHLISAELVRRLVEGAREVPAAAVVVGSDDGRDWDADYIAEATRLRFGAGRRVREIGKSLETWDAIDCGAFLLRPAAWRIVDEAPEDCDLSTIFRIAAGRGELAAADITGAFWYDIDTEDDLIAAEARLRGA